MVRGAKKQTRARVKTEVDPCQGKDNIKIKNVKASDDFKGKLSHGNLSGAEACITRYFSTKVFSSEITSVKVENIDQSEKETPQIEKFEVLHEQELDIKTEYNTNTSPSTPHKIKFFEEKITLSPSGALSQLCISLTPKKAVKSRRRLNPSQITNQLSIPKAKPRLICCSKLSINNNHQVTEYFPTVRRSERKTKRTVLEEWHRSLEEAVLSEKEEGLEVHNFEGKGRGVVTTRHFGKGEFVVEYAGELIDMTEAKNREKLYAQDQNTGCYMYYFKYKNEQWCVDATAESGRLGRLVNHSRNGNLVTKTVAIKERPHLVLIAKDNILPGEEVMYDYGDRSKESIRYHPWLTS